MDANGDEKLAPVVVADVRSKDWRQAVLDLRKQVGPGYLVFCFEQGFGRGPDQIALMRGTDQFAILRTVGTNGINYDIGPEKVQARVQAWDKRYGLDIVAAGFDWMQADLKRPPANMEAFAKEVYKFCPDVVEQGTNTVKELAKEMKAGRLVYLWWD